MDVFDISIINAIIGRASHRNGEITLDTLDLNGYDTITKDMDLPECKLHDWAWLIRHMPIRNSDHPNFERSYEFVKEQYRMYRQAE